ncbi:hypothetical protein H3H36_15720 [Duganella sp. FT3S]|uniref:Uncharacterized protein n=1 Tax=Rugamonas fusca TaxID=2758568 RepID=A0A7W2EIZ0_9BURK|nr:hypothetical protein [Rugamonas fusca]MBA5606804.1 hypothetical protein [Rugamonas fusca]
MPNLTLSDVVDVFSKAGTPKATKVKQIKNRAAYQPATDFYRTLRSAIVSIHANGKDRSALDGIVPSLADVKKIGNYQDIIDGYKKFWGKKVVGWFDPPRGSYSHAGVDVLVNPELGLIIDGKRIVIKLYFKADEITKARIELVPVLMEVVLRANCQEGDLVALLDVRKAKLYYLGVSTGPAIGMLNAELAYVAALWPSV